MRTFLIFFFSVYILSSPLIAEEAKTPETATQKESADRTVDTKRAQNEKSLDAAETSPAVVEKSAILVIRSNGQKPQIFASVFAPKLAAYASASGIAVSPTEIEGQAESRQITEARTRGAHYLIEVNVTAYSVKVNTILSQESRKLSANVTWRLLDITGNTASVGSGQITDSSMVDTFIAEDEQLAEFSDRIAKKCGEEIAAKFNEAKGKSVLEVPVQFVIKADELTFPSIVVDENNVVARSKNALSVELSGFTLTCDGIVLGTVPASTLIKLPRGLRTITLNRPGFEPWSAKINVKEGLVFEPVIRPTEEGILRWRNQTAFLQGLVDGAKLNDAEAEKVRGAAESLRNSGYKTNIDIKVDAKELPAPIIVPR